MSASSPFHEGEVRIQQRLGVFDSLDRWARKVVRPCMPEQHREFFGALPFAVAAARDGTERPWVTLLSGEPGFMRASDSRHLTIAARPLPGDALERALEEGADVGILGIDLGTRRRNRLNGRVLSRTSEGIELGVSQSFGNCPQHITVRDWERREAVPSASSALRLGELTGSLRSWIESADTFFIATGFGGSRERPSHGMDASHRGGSPGFVRVDGPRALSFPDYAGNNHFNTVGNLEMDPRAGLLFVDFESGSLLQLTGTATVDWDAGAVADLPGAERMIRFELDEAVWIRGALPLRWTQEPKRSLRLTHKVRESDEVVSFLLSSDDGEALADFAPGQHLPVEVALEAGPGGDLVRARRTYSISNRPGEGNYRISVKRETEGLVSRFLHDRLDVGDRLDVFEPKGDFQLVEGDAPIALVSAGVGVTPMLSMLSHLVEHGDPREVHFVHVARDGRHHAHAEEVRRLVSASPRIHSRIHYSRPLAGDRARRDFDRAGRLDVEDLVAALPRGAEIYLCGPLGFMAELRMGLEARGVPAERIHSESFGATR